jgi:hypothetical protein
MIDITWRHDGTSEICRGTMSKEKFVKNCATHRLFVADTVRGTILGWYDRDSETTTWTKILFEESY